MSSQDSDQFKGKRRIQQSVKIANWGTNFDEESSRNFFDKYARGGREQETPLPTNAINDHQEEAKHFNTEVSQVKSIETGFKKLKIQQIEKLKDLKQQYQNLKHLTTEQTHFVAKPKSPSHSSEHSDIIVSNKKTKQKSTGRQAHIYELQKRQLQIMVENSMKKVEELLHNQMQYKKTIHDLKIQIENRINIVDNDHIVKLLKKKQKDLLDTVNLLEIERQNLLTTTHNLREKNRQLEALVSNYQIQIRKLTDDRQNNEDALRVEKDRYFTLQIENRRFKKEYELLQNEKNAQITRLTRFRDERGGVAQKELRLTISSLQQELKLREKRYNLLLEQLEQFRREKINNEKESELRALNDLMKTLPAGDSSASNKKLEEALKSIMDRITELENKPVIQIETIIDKQKEKEQRDLENRIAAYQRRIKDQIKQKDIALLRIKILESSANTQIQELKRKDSKLLEYKEIQQNLEEQIARLKNKLNQRVSIKIQKPKLTSNQSQTEIPAPPKPARASIQISTSPNVASAGSQTTKPAPPPIEVNIEMPKIEDIQVPIPTSVQIPIPAPITIPEPQQFILNEIVKTTLEPIVITTPPIIKECNHNINEYLHQIQNLKVMIDSGDDENRLLKRNIESITFELQKTKESAQLQQSLLKKAHLSQANSLSQDISRLRGIIQQNNQQIVRLNELIKSIVGKKNGEINQIRSVIDGLRTRNYATPQQKIDYDQQLIKIREEHAKQLNQLTGKLQKITTYNERLVLEGRSFNSIVEENNELRALLRNVRSLNNGVDHLWTIKQTEYQMINGIIKQFHQIPQVRIVETINVNGALPSSDVSQNAVLTRVVEAKEVVSQPQIVSQQQIHQENINPQVYELRSSQVSRSNSNYQIANQTQPPQQQIFRESQYGQPQYVIQQQPQYIVQQPQYAIQQKPQPLPASRTLYNQNSTQTESFKPSNFSNAPLQTSQQFKESIPNVGSSRLIRLDSNDFR